MEERRQFKLVLVGDPKVGKTSIRKRYMGFGFSKSHLMTLGADFSEKEIIFKNKEQQRLPIRLQIWDIAGQDTFSTIRSRFLSKASGIMLIFDLTRKETFRNLHQWLKSIWTVNQRRDIPLLLIGNKNDLQNDRVIALEEIKDFVKSLQSHVPELRKFHFLETSALTGESIEDGFKIMTKLIISE